MIKTRVALEQELAAKGVIGSALESLLRETGPARHKARVAAARVAAEEYYLQAWQLDRDEEASEFLQVGTGAILWADVVGIGGRDGVGGSATQRHPALTQLGKGRKHATDGDAWSAAILEAAQKTDCWFRVNTAGYLVIASGIAEVALHVFIPPPWQYAVLREGLRRAAGLPGWHQQCPIQAPPESLPEWARLVNEREAASLEGQPARSDYQQG